MGIEIKDVIYRQLAGCLCCAEFTDEQREIQQVARRFAKDEIIPKAAYHDQTGEVADQCTIAIFCLLWLPACKQFNNSQRFTLQDHSSTPSSAAVLTTVMPCYTALQIVSFSDCSLCRTLLRGWSMACRERSTSHRSWSLCIGYRFGNGWLTSWQLWCTNALMAALRSTWQSFVIPALTDVQEWDQLTVGSSTYRARRLHVVTSRSPSLVHAPGTTYLMPSKIRLCHSWHSQNC